MFSLFSMPTQSAKSGPRPIEIQLLADEEILKIWDQAQNVLNNLEEQGMPSAMSYAYSYTIECELQRRAQLRPSLLFELTNTDGKKETKSIHKTPIAQTILATSIMF